MPRGWPPGPAHAPQSARPLRRAPLLTMHDSSSSPARRAPMELPNWEAAIDEPGREARFEGRAQPRPVLTSPVPPPPVPAFLLFAFFFPRVPPSSKSLASGSCSPGVWAMSPSSADSRSCTEQQPSPSRRYASIRSFPPIA